eukprot:TRINITY_DN1620_c0_g3_i1.p1 TRINITY_DN1620_c0_g3~~TRINITY_DN1620_c0_g3_i1.p1  ORF type:complete len:130 (-),score=15.91 TRINITY_DN1620_c0_g3_i1:238-627(-)
MAKHTPFHEQYRQAFGHFHAKVFRASVGHYNSAEFFEHCNNVLSVLSALAGFLSAAGNTKLLESLSPRVITSCSVAGAIGILLCGTGLFTSKMENHRAAGNQLRTLSERLWTFSKLHYPNLTEEEATTN